MADFFDTFSPDADTAEPAADPAPAAPAAPAAVPEPVEAAAPAPVANVDPAPVTVAPTPEAPKLVPLAALHESRQKEREWRETAARIERESQAKLQAIELRIQQLQNPPPQVPTFEDDPANNLRAQMEEQQRVISALHQEAVNTRQIRDSQNFENRVTNDTQTLEAAFVQRQPDYHEAVKYLQAVSAKNMALMGITDPAQVQGQIRQQAMQMAVRALQAGQNPAEMAFNLAVNYGYKAGKEPAKGNPAAKIATLQAGQAAAAVMPAGGTAKHEISVESLAAMDDDEFNKMIDDPASWRKLMQQVG